MASKKTKSKSTLIVQGCGIGYAFKGVAFFIKNKILNRKKNKSNKKKFVFYDNEKDDDNISVIFEQSEEESSDERYSFSIT